MCESTVSRHIAVEFPETTSASGLRPRRRSLGRIALAIAAMAPVCGAAAVQPPPAGGDALAAYCLGILSGADPTAESDPAKARVLAPSPVLAASRARWQAYLERRIGSADQEVLFHSRARGQADIAQAPCISAMDHRLDQLCLARTMRLIDNCLRPSADPVGAALRPGLARHAPGERHARAAHTVDVERRRQCAWPPDRRRRYGAVDYLAADLYPTAIEWMTPAAGAPAGPRWSTRGRRSWTVAARTACRCPAWPGIGVT